MMDGFAFPVKIVRTDRKRSASIQLEGEIVTVRVPKTLSDTRIRDLITKRIPWIRSKLREQAARPSPKPKEYVSGEAFPYLGKNYRLKVIKGETPSLKLKGGYMQAIVAKTDKTPAASIKSLLLSWYKEHAELRLRDKTERLAKIIGVTPNSVSVRDYKSRWGSCSVNGDISYNWRIILASHHIIDYVVVHELCHMLEHNHSAHFWKQVERHIPDWRACRDWLKNNNSIVF